MNYLELFEKKQDKEFIKKLEKQIEEINFKSEGAYPFVSIVFPNWNGKNDTVECLSSLEKLNYPKSQLEIIIVDNGSKDGSPTAIKNKFAQMENQGWFKLLLIENQKNLGAPAAYNKGAAAANKNFNYLWKLDNDIVVDPNSLIRLAQTGEANSVIGIIGGIELMYFKKDVIRTLGEIIYSKTVECGPYNGIKFKDLKHNYYFVDVSPGPTTLIKRDVWDKLEGFKEIYFVFYDDVDFCHRVKKLGLKIIGVKNSIIWHKKGGATGDVFSIFGTFYYLRNKIVFLRINFSGFDKFYGIIKFIFVENFIYYMAVLKKLKLPVVPTIIKAIFLGLFIRLNRNK